MSGRVVKMVMIEVPEEDAFNIAYLQQQMLQFSGRFPPRSACRSGKEQRGAPQYQFDLFSQPPGFVAFNSRDEPQTRGRYYCPPRHVSSKGARDFDSDSTCSGSSNSETAEVSYVNKVKTEMCKSIKRNQICGYGNKCAFAHSKSELRSKTHLPANAKTKNCNSFHESGLCWYTERCHYKHDERNLNDFESVRRVTWRDETELPKQRLPVFEKLTEEVPQPAEDSNLVRPFAESSAEGVEATQEFLTQFFSRGVESLLEEPAGFCSPLANGRLHDRCFDRAPQPPRPSVLKPVEQCVSSSRPFLPAFLLEEVM